jgi:predicted glycosyltransferase
MTMRIVAGPFLPENEWVWLQGEASGIEGVELVRHVPDLTAQMRQSAVSVSQCGYNSALDIVQSGVPALVVPYGDDKENEQRDRAERLARLGVVRMLLPGELNADALAAEIRNLPGFVPAAAAIGLDGAERSAEILQGLAGEYRLPIRQAGSTRRAEGAMA